MEYNHWYDEYQQNGSQQQAQKPHRGVSIPALIA